MISYGPSTNRFDVQRGAAGAALASRHTLSVRLYYGTRLGAAIRLTAKSEIFTTRETTSGLANNNQRVTAMVRVVLAI